MLKINVNGATSLDAAWDRARNIADKFFGEREYRLEYVEAEVSNHEEPFTYKVTFHAAECANRPYVVDALRLVG